MRARVAARAARGCARLREAARLWVECHVTSGGSSSWSGSTVGCRGGRGWRRGARCPPRRGAKASARAPCSRGWHWWRRGGRRSGRRKYLGVGASCLDCVVSFRHTGPPPGGGVVCWLHADGAWGPSRGEACVSTRLGGLLYRRSVVLAWLRGRVARFGLRLTFRASLARLVASGCRDCGAYASAWSRVTVGFGHDTPDRL
jgi:hypothetical protein